VISKQKRIIIKPNLTTNRGPSCTTDKRMVEALINFFYGLGKEIIIAEASGGCETSKCFKELGYTEVAKKYGIELMDLNNAETVLCQDRSAYKLKEFKLPKILSNSFLISVPVLKEHDWAKITCALKNMFGIASGRFYDTEPSSGWNKAGLHSLGVDECIVDINCYRKPDLSLVDARIGQFGNEIYGHAAKPPFNIIFGGFDAVAVDFLAAKLLGHDPLRIKHLQLALERGLSQIRSFEDVLIDTDTNLEWRKNKSPFDRARAFAIRKLGARVFSTIRGNIRKSR
jgi:uncharacterized protein (DUF362 family)